MSSSKTLPTIQILIVVVAVGAIAIGALKLFTSRVSDEAITALPNLFLACSKVLGTWKIVCLLDSIPSLARARKFEGLGYCEKQPASLEVSDVHRDLLGERAKNNLLF